VNDAMSRVSGVYLSVIKAPECQQLPIAEEKSLEIMHHVAEA
jgi:hypothetical protein